MLWLLCVGCGICIERCQVDAIKLVLKRYIGCGACVPTCSEGEIPLKKKEEEAIPPSTMEDLYLQIMNKKQQLRKK